MALLDVTQRAGQLESHTMDLTVPSIGGPRLESATCGLDYKARLHMYWSPLLHLFFCLTFLCLSPQAPRVRHTGGTEVAWTEPTLV